MPRDVVCKGFAWLGQSFKYCDDCGHPYWEHSHMQWRGELEPITPESAASIRAREADE